MRKPARYNQRDEENINVCVAVLVPVLRQGRALARLRHPVDDGKGAVGVAGREAVTD